MEFETSSASGSLVLSDGISRAGAKAKAKVKAKAKAKAPPKPFDPHSTGMSAVKKKSELSPTGYTTGTNEIRTSEANAGKKMPTNSDSANGELMAAIRGGVPLKKSGTTKFAGRPASSSSVTGNKHVTLHPTNKPPAKELEKQTVILHRGPSPQIQVSPETRTPMPSHPKEKLPPRQKQGVGPKPLSIPSTPPIQAREDNTPMVDSNQNKVSPNSGLRMHSSGQFQLITDAKKIEQAFQKLSCRVA